MEVGAIVGIGGGVGGGGSGGRRSVKIISAGLIDIIVLINIIDIIVIIDIVVLIGSNGLISIMAFGLIGIVEIMTGGIIRERLCFRATM